MSFLKAFQLEGEHTTKRWWFGFIFSIAILVLSNYYLDLNDLEIGNKLRLTVIYFAGVYIFKIILMYFIYQLIKIRPKKEEEIVDTTKDIDKLKGDIKGSLMVRICFIIIIIFSFLAFYCLYLYIAFNKPRLFDSIYVVVFLSLVLYWGEIIFLLSVEFYIQQVDAMRIIKIGNKILDQGANLSGWKKLEYSLAKRITKRVAKRIEKEKKKEA